MFPEFAQKIRTLEKEVERLKVIDIPGNAGGWISTPPQFNWYYDSSVTITASTVGSDQTVKFPVGTKIRFKQGAGYKYFYVTAAYYGAPLNTLAVFGGSDYTVANAAITDFSYSYEATPQDFPHWFNYSPTITGYSVVPAASRYRFCMIGTTVIVTMREGDGGTGTSNATTTTYSLPVATTHNNMYFSGRIMTLVDNGTTLHGGLWQIATTTTVDMYTTEAGGVWTNSGGKSAAYAQGLIITYEV